MVVVGWRGTPKEGRARKGKGWDRIGRGVDWIGIGTDDLRTGKSVGRAVGGVVAVCKLYALKCSVQRRAAGTTPYFWEVSGGRCAMKL